MLEEGCEKARQLFNFFVRCYPPGSVLPSSMVPCHIYLYQVQSSPISKVSTVDMFFGMQMLSSLLIALARTVANLR
jgi:hypothetical protein